MGFIIVEVVLAVVVWVLMGLAAYAVAPDDRPLTFVLLTLFLLGPLGLAAAAIAQVREPAYVAPPRRPVAADRRRFICPRCGAENDIPESDRSYECWRCSEHRTVKPATKETKPAKTAP